MQPALIGVQRSQMRGSAVNSSKVNGPGSHRMGWLAGLAYRGQTYVVPISSTPFGRGPAGCGAAANKPEEYRMHR